MPGSSSSSSHQRLKILMTLSPLSWLPQITVTMMPSRPPPRALHLKTIPSLSTGFWTMSAWPLEKARHLLLLLPTPSYPFLLLITPKRREIRRMGLRHRLLGGILLVFPSSSLTPGERGWPSKVCPDSGQDI